MPSMPSPQTGLPTRRTAKRPTRRRVGTANPEFAAMLSTFAVEPPIALPTHLPTTAAADSPAPADLRPWIFYDPAPSGRTLTVPDAGPSAPYQSSSLPMLAEQLPDGQWPSDQNVPRDVDVDVSHDVDVFDDRGDQPEEITPRYVSVSVVKSQSGIYFEDLPFLELNETCLIAVMKAHNISRRGRRLLSRYRDLATAHRCTPYCAKRRFVLHTSLPRHDTVDADAVMRHYHRLVAVAPKAVFPPPPSREHDLVIVRRWLDGYSPEKYRRVVCAACSALVYLRDSTVQTVSPDHLALLTDPTLPPGVFPRGYDKDAVNGAMLHCDGILATSPECVLRLCDACWSRLRVFKIPRLALANKTYTGWDNVPEAIQELFAKATQVELSLIARYRTRCTIFKYSRKKGSPEYGSPDYLSQSYTKGHVITFTNGSTNLLSILPPSPNELAESISVIFVGAVLPAPEELKRLTPLLVRRYVVVGLLTWLKENHRLYKDVTLSQEHLDALLPGVESGLPAGLQMQLVTSEGTERLSANTVPVEEPDVPDISEVPMSSVGIIGKSLDDWTVQEAKLASMSDWRRGGSSYSVPHSKTPVREWGNPDLFCGSLPHLFPFGIGGMEEKTTDISLETHVRHLLNCHDTRFATDHVFSFMAMNIVQRRRVYATTRFRIDRGNMAAATEFFEKVDLDALRGLKARAETTKGLIQAENDSERVVLQFIDRMKNVPVNLSGTPASKKQNRNELRSMHYLHGMSAVFQTLNPDDLHHPLFCVLAGLDIDISQRYPTGLPGDFERKRLLAKNPTAAAKFFDAMVDLFIGVVLGMAFEGDGLLGKTVAYYGCVEAQARGSLHIHFLVWISGTLGPQACRDKLQSDADYKKALFDYLHHAISTKLPSNKGVVDPSKAVFLKRRPGEPHSGTLRCPHPDEPGFQKEWNTQLERATYDSHFHRHNATCYKYLKEGQEPHPSLCRMRMTGTTSESTTIDGPTGSILLRRWHPYINQHNPILTMLAKCNNDLKFIGSGQGAKALMYYVTDYITKSDLPMEEVFAAFAKCVERIRDPNNTDSTFIVGGAANVADFERGMKLLTRASNCLLGSREISGQQVALFFEKRDSSPDHYTNVSFAPLVWGNFWRWLRAMEEEAEVDDELEFSPAELSRGVVPSSQLEDYQHRGTALEAAPLYWYVATTIRVSTRDEEVRQSTSRPSLRATPRVPFLESHPRFGKQMVRLRERLACPTIVGPTLPRVDYPDQYEDYCRAMLLLFKPWRKYSDLKQSFPTWAEAFDSFEFSERSCMVMKHMREWNECKDAKDAYADLKKQGLVLHDALSEEIVQTAIRHEKIKDGADTWAMMNESHPGLQGMLTPPFASDRDQVDRLENGQQIVISKHRFKRTAEAKAVIDALINAVGPGFMGTTVTRRPLADHAQTGDDCVSAQIVGWAAETEKIKKRLRAQMLEGNHQSAEPDASDSEDVELWTEPSDDSDIPVMREMDAPLPVLAVDPSTVPELVRQIVRRYDLNAEQEAAFGLIAVHKTCGTAEPLRMFVVGGAGTGKSHVVRAVDSLFLVLQVPEQVAKSAPTGVSAFLLKTETLHVMLGFGLKSSSSDDASKGHALEQLQRRWRHVKYLLIDEVSMVGAMFLSKISTRLQTIMGSPEPFGGLSVIFFGDPRQLPPVCDSAVWSSPDDVISGTLANKQLALDGVRLWSQVDKVITLKTNYRQQRDKYYQGIILRAGEGQTTVEDCEAFRSRLLGKVEVSPEFYDAPLVTCDKAIRYQWNIHCAKRFAAISGQEYVTYVAVDQSQGQLVSPEHQDVLLDMLSSYTRDRLGRLPLVKGMPVMVLTNVVTSGGVVNGAEGTVETIYYDLTDTGERVARCVLVRVNDCLLEYEGLPPGVIPIFPDTKYFSVRLRDQTTISIARRQLPLIPGGARTDFKSQGQGLEYAFIDPASTGRHRQSAYVMVSRVVKLQNLIVLRDFDNELLRRPLLAQARALLTRLQHRSEETQTEWLQSTLRNEMYKNDT